MKNFIKYLWQFPQNIVGEIFTLFLPDRLFLFEYKGVQFYSSQIMRGGVSLGRYVFISSTGNNLNTSSIIHEFGHTKQSLKLGWLYLLVIGIPSVVHAFFHNSGDYYAFYTERWANKEPSKEDIEQLTLNYTRNF